MIELGGGRTTSEVRGKAMLIALVAILLFLLVFFMIAKVVAFLIGLVFLLLVAAICGAIAEKVLHYDGGGIGTTVGVGLTGAIVGWLLAKILHLPLALHIAGLPVLWTIVGSMIMVSGLKVVAPPRRRRLHGPRDFPRL